MSRPLSPRRAFGAWALAVLAVGVLNVALLRFLFVGRWHATFTAISIFYTGVFAVYLGASLWLEVRYTRDLRRTSQR